MEESITYGLHLHGITMSSASLRIIVPPSRVRDLDQLFALQRDGFLPANQLHFDRDEQAFVLELDGEGVSHVLELLGVAMDTREAETWQERQARERQQLPLSFADPVGDFIRSTQCQEACT